MVVAVQDFCNIFEALGFNTVLQEKKGWQMGWQKGWQMND